MISQPTQKLIQQYLAWYQSLQKKEGMATIHVDEIASRVASFYEKVRGIIDWREEHLFRRTAIERSLKRRFFLKKKGEKIATSLVLELIRGGHFPNDVIPEQKIIDVQRLIDKYLFILENSPPLPKKKTKIQLYHWILGVAACETEEILSPPSKERILIDYMTELMQERIKVDEIDEAEKNTQIYIAVQRALFRLDPSIISYHLIKKRYTNWSNLSQSELSAVTKNIYSIWKNIEKDLNHPLAHKFYKICEKYDTPYLLLGDILSEDPTGAQQKISQPETLENLIKEAYDRRAKTLKSRIGRAAIYATLSIFFTNMLVLYAIEIPFTLYVMREPFGLLPRLISILGPTLLMFFLVVTIKLPPKENLQRVIMETIQIVYRSEREKIYEIKPFPKRGFILKTIVGFLYLLSFCLSYG